MISIVTHGELYALGDVNGWSAAKFAALDHMLRNLVTVDVSGEPIVAAYRRLEQVNRAKGTAHHVVGKNDLWIAATAMVTGMPLLTTDEDFVHLHGRVLTVQTA